MKISSFLFINFLWICNALTQYTFPTFNEDPKWYVKDYLGKIEGYSYVKDTIICGKKYSKLFDSEYILNKNTFILNGYLRNEDDKVFYRKTNSCQEKDYLIYDFSLSINDTVYCGYNIVSPYPPDYIDSTKFWVIGIDTIDISGIKRKRLKMRYEIDPVYGDTSFEMDWLVGIGSTSHPFYFFYNWASKSVGFELACLDSSGVLIFHNENISIDCDSLISGINTQSDDLLNNDIQVYPNPSNNNLTIEMADCLNVIHSIELVNSCGQIIRSMNNINNNRIVIGISNLAGTYYVLIRYNDKQVSKKIIFN